MLLIILSSCGHAIHQVQISDFRPYEKYTAGKLIKSKATQWTFLGFVTNTNFVDKARAKLIAQCPNGDIQGILTRHSTALGFLSWTNKIIMKGLCLNSP